MRVRRPVHPGPLEEACRQTRRARRDLVCRSVRQERVQPVLSRHTGRRRGLRKAFRDLQDTPGYRPGDYGMAVATIHEARFVLFDGRHAARVRHELRRAVGRVHGRFPHLGADARAVRRHLPARRGLRRPADLAALKAFVLDARRRPSPTPRNYGGTVKEIRKAQRVNEAFQRVLDDPQAAEALQHPALKPLLEEAAD